MSPLALIFLALFNSVLGFSILFPVLAPLGRELGLVEVQVGLLSTAYAGMQFLLSPLWGKLSDRWGRKPVLLVGIFGFAIGFAAFAAAVHAGQQGLLQGAPLFVALVATRALGGGLSSATFPSAQAYVADITSRENRTSGMAIVGAAFGLGIVVGPGIGGFLSQWGLLTPVYLSVVVALANGLFIALLLKPTVPRPKEERGAPLLLVARRTWPLLVLGTFVTLVSVSMEQTIAFYAQDTLGLTTARTPVVVAALLVSYGVAAVASQGGIVRRWKGTSLSLLYWGLPLSLVGFLFLSVASSFWMLAVGMVLHGLGQGLSLPGVSASLSLHVGELEQGTVAGLNSSTQSLARTFGPLVGTVLYGVTPSLPYLVSVLMAAVLLGAMLLRPLPTAAVSR